MGRINGKLRKEISSLVGELEELWPIIERNLEIAVYCDFGTKREQSDLKKDYFEIIKKLKLLYNAGTRNRT